METDSDVIKSSDELPEVVNERCHARVAVKPGFIQNLFQPGDISLGEGREGKYSSNVPLQIFVNLCREREDAEW